MRERNEHVYLTGKKAYDLLTEYLSDDRKKDLTKQLNELRYSHAEDIAFANKIQKGLWLELFNSAKRAEFPARSLACLRDGLITTMQYVTSQMFYNSFTHPANKNKNVKIEKIFSDKGGLIKNAMQKIEATMKLASSSFLAYMTQKKIRASQSVIPANDIVNNFDLVEFEKAAKAGLVDWASEAEKNKFYTLLSKLPASEQSFIILDDPFFDGFHISDKTSVIQQINYRLNFNIFSRLRINGIPKVMIPSAGMIQCYQEATRPTTRMPAIYRFGFSPIEGLYQTMKSGCRDKIICTALLPECSPTEADGYPANIAYAEAELHDFYHETLCGNIPLNDRKLIGKFIDKLRSIGGEVSSANVKLYTDIASELLIDMELRLYIRNMDKISFMKNMDKIYGSMNPIDPTMRFWATLDFLDTHFEPRLISREKPQNELQVAAIIENVNEGRKLVATQIAAWLLEQDQPLEQLGFDLNKLMKFPSRSHGLIMMVQNELELNLAKRVENKNIEELLAMISEFEMPGPLLSARVKQTMRELITRDITQAIVITFKNESPLMLEMIHDDLAKNFVRYMENGVIDCLKDKYPNEFAYIIKAFCKTTHADTLLKDALSNKRDPLRNQIIDVLYQTERVNHVYPDETTLLQRALRVEHVELILRLTNDGASVVEVPGATKPCPLINSMHSGRYDLIVLLMYAYNHGAGWVEKFPDVATRIRRMAAPYEFGFTTYPEHDEDNKWAQSIIKAKKIPTHLFNSIDEQRYAGQIEETYANLNHFFAAVKTKKGVKLDVNDPVAEAFIRCKQWANEGGVFPTKNTFK